MLRRESEERDRNAWSWLLQYERRRAFAAGRGVFALPLVHRPFDVLLRHLEDGMRVLDVGASDARARDRIAQRFPAVVYRSLDPDPAVRPDYRSVEEVNGRFDIVLLLEVIEHLEPGGIAALFGALPRVLADRGRLVISTPNVFHPSAWFRDMTHRTPVAWDELGGLLEGCGYRVVEMARVYPGAFVPRLIRRTLGAPLHRWLGVDFARAIVAVAEPAGAAARSGAHAESAGAAPREERSALEDRRSALEDRRSALEDR